MNGILPCGHACDGLVPHPDGAGLYQCPACEEAAHLAEVAEAQRKFAEARQRWIARIEHGDAWYNLQCSEYRHLLAGVDDVFHGVDKPRVVAACGFVAPLLIGGGRRRRCIECDQIKTGRGGGE